MDAAADLQKRLQIKQGSRVWLWPEQVDTPRLLEPVDDSVARAPLAEADVAVLFTENRAAVDAVLTEHLSALAPLRAVWVVYAKANKTDVNRNTLWTLLADYGWRAVANVSYDVRCRPCAFGR